MRCRYFCCELNEEGYCRQPDYVVIDEKGECEQLIEKRKTITEKYNELRKIADEAYTTFDSNPTQANSDAYGMALNNLRDFCIEVIATMVEKRPDITDNIFWEED